MRNGPISSFADLVDVISQKDVIFFKKFFIGIAGKFSRDCKHVLRPKMFLKK